MATNKLSQRPIPQADHGRSPLQDQRFDVEEDSMQLVRQIVRVLATLLTVTLAIAAIAPQTLDVPASWRAWVYVSFVFWFIAYCSGMSNL